MKKITFLLLAGFFISLPTFSQVLPDNWTGDTDIDIYQESTDPHGGTYCAKVEVIGTGNSSSDFDNLTSLSVTAGNTYKVSFWYKTSAHVKGRIHLIWSGASGAYGTYTDANATSWTEFTYSGTVPSGATALSLGIRFYDQTGFVSPENQYIDDLTFESPTGTPITVTNGNLESWPTGNQAPVITNIVNTPAIPKSTETVSVQADVTDDVSVSTVECKWGTADGGPYPNTINMSLDAGDTYETDSDISAQTDGTTVYYVIEATDGEPETTTSPQQSYTVTDPDPEPTNYPTAFAATTNSASAITTSWTDATGAQLPAGYLVLANETGTFTDPVDGTPVADDTDMSDSEGAMNVAYGVETYQWTGLSDNMPYYFKIYPYTNSASIIDYKTDGTPPTANATTDEANTDLIISEVADPSGTGSHDYRFVEIMNTSLTTINFNSETWYLCRQIAGGNWQDVELTGTVASESLFVIASSASHFTTEYGFAPNQSSSSISGTGDDGFFLYKDGGHASGTLIDAFGEIDVDGSGEPWEYTDAKAVRLRSVSSPKSTWTASEWYVPDAARRDDMTPREHKADVTWDAGGTSADDWHEKGDNWIGTADGYIPDASFNVTIPSTTVSPVISDEASCFQLTLEEDAIMDVAVGGELTCADDLESFPGGRGDAAFIIQSSASGNGSVIVGGSASGPAHVQRYFQGYDDGASNGWHNIGSPVNNMDISGTGFDPTGTSDDLYRWDEPTDTWENYKQGHFTFFANGSGYLCAFQSTETNSFSGTLNTSDVAVSNLTLGGDGWHLLGNPFASAIEWNNGDWSLSNVSGTCQIWDESINNYYVLDPNYHIPSTNGFFVEVSSATNSLTIPASARTHSTFNNYKSSRTEGNEETLVMTVTNDENTYYDLNRIGFRSDATEEWDIAFDAHKLFGGETAPQLWTVSNDENFAQNYLPYVYDSYQVPLHFGAGVNSTYHINADGLESFYSNSEIYLEDLFTEDIINLSEQQLYTFTATTDDDEARFVIHFYGVTSTGENSDVENGKIYAYQNTVYVKFNELPSDTYQVEVINMVGQQVYSNEFTTGGLNSFNLNEKPGIYFVRLHAENRTMVQKVMISK